LRGLLTGHDRSRGRGAAGADGQQEVPAGKLGVFLRHDAPPCFAVACPMTEGPTGILGKLQPTYVLIKRNKNCQTISDLI
jgi:hypothetical protein